jgi:hypothetical protein
MGSDLHGLLQCTKDNVNFNVSLGQCLESTGIASGILGLTKGEEAKWVTIYPICRRISAVAENLEN